MVYMINVLLPLISTVIDRVVPDKNGANKAKQAIEAELIANATQLNLAQAETNKIEAAHRSVWVAGWRPALGWVSALSFAWIFLLAPITQWILLLTGNTVVLPVLQSDVLLELTFALLGLAGLRTYEKQKGLSK
ncbi:putative holin family protein [Methylophilales phage MEP301]|nr:putative holin family protein [Methylophilales phage MEP301]